MNMPQRGDLQSVLAEFSELPDFVGIELARVSQKGNFGNTPLHVAVIQNNIDSASALIRLGAEINAIGEAGYTPLHEAVEQGHLGMTRFLLDSGAAKNIKNEDGLTSLQLAESLHLDEIIELLKI